MEIELERSDANGRCERARLYGRCTPPRAQIIRTRAIAMFAACCLGDVSGQDDAEICERAVGVDGELGIGGGVTVKW